MKIAIVDDDSIFMDEVKDIIVERINKIGINDFSISTFSSPEQLLVDIHSFDLLIIDVEINQYNGISICNQIRKSNTDIIIMFISSYTTYVFNSFIVSPFSYILKKDLNNKGISEIDRCLQFYMNKNKTIKISSFGIEYSLVQRDIKVISKISDKCVFFYNDKQFESRINLKDILILNCKMKLELRNWDKGACPFIPIRAAAAPLILIFILKNVHRNRII